MPAIWAFVQHHLLSIYALHTLYWDLAVQQRIRPALACTELTVQWGTERGKPTLHGYFGKRECGSAENPKCGAQGRARRLPGRGGT